MILGEKEKLTDYSLKNPTTEFKKIKAGEVELPRGAGNFIYLLIKSMNAKRILQIGTFGGNNTLWLGAAVAPNKGNVIALECDPAKSEIARLNFQNANLTKTIELIDSNIETTVQQFQTPFDLLLLDAPIQQYLSYYQLAYPKIRSGGVIIADRAISHNEELITFFNFIYSQKELESILVPVGKGLIVSYKNKIS